MLTVNKVAISRILETTGIGFDSFYFTRHASERPVYFAVELRGGNAEDIVYGACIGRC
jgi:hypothetical protein